MGNCFSSKDQKNKSKKSKSNLIDQELKEVLTSDVPKLQRDDRQKSMVHPTWSREQLRKAEAFVGGDAVVKEIDIDNGG